MLVKLYWYVSTWYIFSRVLILCVFFCFTFSLQSSLTWIASGKEPAQALHGSHYSCFFTAGASMFLQCRMLFHPHESRVSKFHQSHLLAYQLSLSWLFGGAERGRETTALRELTASIDRFGRCLVTITRRTFSFPFPQNKIIFFKFGNLLQSNPLLLLGGSWWTATNGLPLQDTRQISPPVQCLTVWTRKWNVTGYLSCKPQDSLITVLKTEWRKCCADSIQLDCSNCVLQFLRLLTPMISAPPRNQTTLNRIISCFPPDLSRRVIASVRAV